MTLNAFERTFWKSLKEWKDETGGFVHRFNDSGYWVGRKRMSVPQPADFMLIHNGTPLMLELKSSRHEPSFPIGNIREHQLDSLIDFKCAGGIAGFLIARTSKTRGQTAYYVDVGDYQRNILTSPKKSTVKWDIIEANATSSLTRGAGRWPIEELVLDAICR